MVKAKFYCWEIAKQFNGQRVTLSPVYMDNEENKKFWAATPSGKLEMFISNETAAQYFELGKEYYLTFEEAPTQGGLL